MNDWNTRKRMVALARAGVFLISGFLAGTTVATIRRVGLTGARPPLATVDVVIRIFIVVGVFVLLYVFRGSLERVTLVIGAAAAGSSVLYGFGVRSAGLSGFRLLSHLAAYALAMVVALRRLAIVRRELQVRRR